MFSILDELAACLHPADASLYRAMPRKLFATPLTTNSKQPDDLIHGGSKIVASL